MSREVFSLRNEAKYLEGEEKLSKLKEAYKLAQSIIRMQEDDIWTHRARGWVLVDICKYLLTTNKEAAKSYFKILETIKGDQIFEDQKQFVAKKLDNSYSDVQKATELSKNGHHIESLRIFENISNPIHHEAFGWAIFRYINNEYENLTFNEVNNFLNQYLELKNPRPSMLHSHILQFSIRYSKARKDFKLYDYFNLWGGMPNSFALFRQEDKKVSFIQEKKIRSLVFRVLKQIVFSETEYDVGRLMFFIERKVKGEVRFLKSLTILDYLRESFYILLLVTEQEEDLNKLWTLFKQYNLLFSGFQPTDFHFKVLIAAQRFMVEDNEQQFVFFFKKWNENKIKQRCLVYFSTDGKHVNPLIHDTYKKLTEIDGVKIIKGWCDSGETVMTTDNKPTSYNWAKKCKNDNQNKYLYLEDFLEESKYTVVYSKFENFNRESFFEVKKDDKIYAPLAYSSLRNCFNIIKQQDSVDDVSWLISIYDEVISGIERPPRYLKKKDDYLLWLNRDKAFLYHYKNDSAKSIVIYKQLVFKLGDKPYFWEELALFLNNLSPLETQKSKIKDVNSLKIGMLSRAIFSGSDEMFLGKIRLQLARFLIDMNLYENAYFELITYKNIYELKGWKLPDIFFDLFEKTTTIENKSSNNTDLYNKYIPLAESYMYADIDWVELILIDIYDDKNKKCWYRFSDSSKIDVRIPKNKFNNLTNLTIGTIYRSKVYLKEKNTPFDKLEYEYFPLCFELSSKPDWSILDDEFAVVEYANDKKKVLHLITVKNEQVFVSNDFSKYKKGDFVKAKRLVLKQEEKRNKIIKKIELKNIEVINREDVIDKFERAIVIVDWINEEKNIFHWIGEKDLKGVVSFDDIKFRPDLGEFVEIYFCRKTVQDKQWSHIEKTYYYALDVNQYKNEEEYRSWKAESNLSCITNTGYLTLNYKFSNPSKEVPDFGFVDNCYVSKNLLLENNIVVDCDVVVTMVGRYDSSGKYKYAAIKLKLVNPI